MGKQELPWLWSAVTWGQLIGFCALFGFEGQYKAEIGYWLGAEFQGQGFMGEAVETVVAHAFDSMRMGRIFAQTSTRNLASIAMLRKAGFVQEGVLRQSSLRDGMWDDTALMAVVSSDRQ